MSHEGEAALEHRLVVKAVEEMAHGVQTVGLAGDLAFERGRKPLGKARDERAPLADARSPPAEGRAGGLQPLAQMVELVGAAFEDPLHGLLRPDSTASSRARILATRATGDTLASWFASRRSLLVAAGIARQGRIELGGREIQALALGREQGLRRRKGAGRRAQVRAVGR